jgi:hypothetical protein
MEPLVFGIVAMRTLYNRKEPFVPEPLLFQPIDVQGLKRSYEMDDDSWSGPVNRQERLETQSAS